ncbi:hypothetical protein HGRIS_003727 [Hohenbuehelia grisea]|uniref:Uncharacterized protein n=1 Tax=Hohenbuehelia grisea TaxID=104357 RepID=A0ABR3JGG3_9AGAR
MFRQLALIAALAVFSAALPSSIDAASLRVRRASNSTVASGSGNIACDEARLSILLALTVAGDATDKIVPSELSSATSLAAAQKGLAMANTGIKQIALAITNKQPPPAESRDLVGGGIGIALSALGSINGTDATNGNLTLANAQLQKAATAGDDVVTNCK